MGFSDFSAPLRDLYIVHGLAGALKSAMFAGAFGEPLSEAPWSVDLSGPAIELGAEQRRFPVQFLGSYDRAQKAWLWAWANPGSDLPPNAIKASLALKKFGEKHSVPELTAPSFSCDPDDLAPLGLIFMSLLGRDADFFFCGAMGDLVGAMVVYRSGLVDLSRAEATDIMASITQTPMPYVSLPRAVRSLFKLCSFMVEEQGDTIRGAGDEGHGVEVTFHKGSHTMSIEKWPRSDSAE